MSASCFVTKKLARGLVYEDTQFHLLSGAAHISQEINLR